MNTNIRTKVVNDTNELIFKNKDLLVDNSADSDTTIAEDNVTVTIVQPKDTKYSIIVYIMEYRRSDEGDIFEADTDEGHRETFKAAKGSVYLVVLLDNTTNSTSTDYYRLNTSSRGKLTRDITIKFKDDSPATNPDATITIVQTDNQTIHVYTPQKSGGTDHTSTFTCPVGTTYEVEVIADKGYIAGTPNTTEGTFNSDMTINATSAIVATAKVTIVQSDNQTIHVYTPQKSGGTDHTSSFTCPIGTTYEVEVIADNNYNAGTPNTKGGTFNSDMTINANPATLATATITIAQSDNQTIHVYTPQKSGGTDHTSTFTCPTGTTYEVEVVADKGYIAGIPNTTEGTFNSDMTINASPAAKAQIYIAKGSAPWYNTYDNNNDPQHSYWHDKSKVINIDESIPGQATVTCKNVDDMNSMFMDCSKLALLDLSNFDTSKVKDMGFMLNNCSKLASIDISNFDTSKVTNMGGMFCLCSNLATIDTSIFNTSNVVNMSQMFMGCSNLTLLDVTNFNTAKVTDMRELFANCSSLTSLDVTKFNTSKVTDMGEVFDNCSNLTSLDVTNFDTSNADSMFFMFMECSKLTSLDVSNFNTAKVTDMRGMFGNCSKLDSLDVTNFDTSKVTGMGLMFCNCSKLTSLDVTNFNTSNVTDMSHMFSGCENLTSLNVTNFDTSNVDDMEYMFCSCSKLTSLDLSNFDTSKVTGMNWMFDGCSNITSLDLSNFNTSNATNMIMMFENCSKLTTIKGIIDMKSCTEYKGMFNNCPKLSGVKIKNPPADFESKTELSSSQYTIVS